MSSFLEQVLLHRQQQHATAGEAQHTGLSWLVNRPSRENSRQTLGGLSSVDIKVRQPRRLTALDKIPQVLYKGLFRVFWDIPESRLRNFRITSIVLLWAT
jgi:hypothetical protein